MIGGGHSPALPLVVNVRRNRRQGSLYSPSASDYRRLSWVMVTVVTGIEVLGAYSESLGCCGNGIALHSRCGGIKLVVG